MYKVTDKKFKNWDEYKHGKPLVCLEDEYGGQSVIATDDHCFVLYNGSNRREFVSVKHWYREAVNALKEFLINNPKFEA
jgi:hypothetical protein